MGWPRGACGSTGWVLGDSPAGSPCPAPSWATGWSSPAWRGCRLRQSTHRAMGWVTRSPPMPPTHPTQPTHPYGGVHPDPPTLGTKNPSKLQPPHLISPLRVGVICGNEMGGKTKKKRGAWHLPAPHYQPLWCRDERGAVGCDFRVPQGWSSCELPAPTAFDRRLKGKQHKECRLFILEAPLPIPLFGY